MSGAFLVSIPRRLERLEEGIAIMLLAATAALVFVGAAGRALGNPLTWSVALAELTFIWTCVFSADVALRRNVHIRIDLFLLKLPLNVQRIVEVLILLIELAFTVALVKYGIVLALSNWQRPLGATGFSYSWVTLALPFGGGLMSITLLRQLLCQLVFNRKAKAAKDVSGSAIPVLAPGDDR